MYNSSLRSGDAFATAYRMLWSPLSSRKLARMAALSFWMTARSSAMVFAARTLRMNCFTMVELGVSESAHREAGDCHTGAHLEAMVDNPANGSPGVALSR